ncbi:hypothetical protein RxyAA322_17930 [Rubrobacter xylanophilus]|uniref:Mut7-C RNAse domain-containing protein n=1 Tax=Rubrobacter xylanophilus TaxID=49319 RepID=A0A510HIY6_9ACTN|nr:Mut7-C RNAse domain-containing protein [Rubrobacter xylanophilus]BBL79939.1 hypothetical protein RxyAA322_17930 [Rubrobacter xylanophilus]
MRFLCDAMLGGLAKWLRAAGYDASCARGEPDGEIVRRAMEEDRVILTCDGGFMERAPVRDGRVGVLLLPQDLSVEEQLRVVATHFGLRRLPSRCMECNGELAEASPEDVADDVPPGVAGRQRLFFRCRGCRRVFWYGSHWERIGGRLGRVFG